MIHIRQKDSSVVEGQTYTVVKTDGYEDLSQHPSILTHPDLFEIVDAEIPDSFQFLKYN